MFYSLSVVALGDRKTNSERRSAIASGISTSHLNTSVLKMRVSLSEKSMAKLPVKLIELELMHGKLRSEKQEKGVRSRMLIE